MEVSERKRWSEIHKSFKGICQKEWQMHRHWSERQFPLASHVMSLQIKLHLSIWRYIGTQFGRCKQYVSQLQWWLLVTQCGKDDLVFGDKCYKFITKQKKFKDAKKFCMHQKGKLLEIQTEEERKFIEEAIKKDK